MQDGNIVVNIETSNAWGKKLLKFLSQAPSQAVFAGQGSQEPGMGMDNSSPAARAVWEGADARLLAVYGFSIIEIVKDNPKEKTIDFGGIKGQAIRQRYMDMTYDTMDKDGHVRTLPLSGFADIDVRCPPGGQLARGIFGSRFNRRYSSYFCPGVRFRRSNSVVA